MSTKRICVAITARPSYSRIRTALQALTATPGVEVKVLCSGSAILDRYGRVADLIRADGYEVVEELYTFVEGNEPVNMALTTASTIQQTATALRRLQPDRVITIADRYETLGTAVAAAYLGLPLIHIQGGEITGNIDEKVRHAVTKLADLHLVSNQRARERIIRMGENPAAVHITGCPSIDLAREATGLGLATVQQAINELGVGAQIDLAQDYLVVLLHPETDHYERSYERMAMLLQTVKESKLPVLVFWPNVDAGSDATSKAIRVFREANPAGPIRYLKNLEGHLFLRLLNDCRCLLGNSSVGIRECAYLGTPVVNVGHRQTGRDRAANVVDSDWQPAALAAALQTQLGARRHPPSTLYGDGHAGAEIARAVCTLEIKTEKHFHET